MKTILIVEDDHAIGEFLQFLVVQENPYTALLVASSDKALEIVRQVQPHLLIIDYYLMHSTGIDRNYSGYLEPLPNRFQSGTVKT